MILNPGQVIETLVNQLRRFHFLVFDDDWVVVFREGERVDPPSMLGTGGELSSDETTPEDRFKISFDQCM